MDSDSLNPKVNLRNLLRVKLVDKEILMQYNINCIVNNAVCASGSVVERLLAKEKVAGSIPVSRFFYTGNKKLKFCYLS